MINDSAVQAYNKQAMEDLRYENYDNALKLLQKAQDLLFKLNSKNSAKLQAMTYNNFGCFYKATGKHELALSYLKKALNIERNQDFDVSNLAGTHLNISAIYSQIGSHGQSLTHAVTALKLLKTVCNGNNLKNITALIIALHNTGLEYEVLGDVEKAAGTFKYGLELAQQFLGNKHQYTTALLKSFLSVTTTDKKYYFEKARMSRGRPKKDSVILPKVKKRNSQDLGIRKTITGFLNTSDDSLANHDLPLIEKPSTFGGRVKAKQKKEKPSWTDQFSNFPKPANPANPAKQAKPETGDYVKTLEQKVNFLQSQFADFEKRHKVLEEVARKTRRLSSDSTFYSRSESNQRNRAAIMIQKHWRRFAAQKKYKKLKNRKKNQRPKKIVQSSKPASLPQSPRRPALSNPSSKYPSSMKTYSLHPIVESKLESKSQEATLIQSNFRMFLQKKNFEQIKSATVKIQSHLRRFMCRALFKGIVGAVKFIQRAWRQHRKRKAKLAL